jgi:L-methionine (R)-S-oxide reductase
MRFQFNVENHQQISPREFSRASLPKKPTGFKSLQIFCGRWLPAVADCRMFELKPPGLADKAEAYVALASQLRALLHGERDFIANCANTAALLWHSLPDLNWAGFYRLADGELVLGPFLGKPACVRIQLGKGVCGRAAATRKTVLVPDVHKFPGHIVCDTASKSEIVVPLMKGGRLLGVLDLDSPKLNRFDATDQIGLEKLAEIIIAASDW